MQPNIIYTHYMTRLDIYFNAMCMKKAYACDAGWLIIFTRYMVIILYNFSFPLYQNTISQYVENEINFILY